jgi:hypothetical protein
MLQRFNANPFDTYAGMGNVRIPVALFGMSLFVAPTLKFVWLNSYVGNANLLWIQEIMFALMAGSVLVEFAASALRVRKQQKAEAQTQVKFSPVGGQLSQ